MPAPPNKANNLDQAAALALARQGKDAWNAWAEDPANDGASVDFSDYDFTDDPISFSGFIFPGPANFQGCTFADGNFYGATFKSEADFFAATFTGDADFMKVTFGEGEYATFSSVIFEKYALFFMTKFRDDAKFDGATFAKGSYFTDAQFDGAANFHSVEFGGPVYLNGAVFKFVPELRFTKIVNHFTLHGVQVEYAKSDERAMWLGLSWAKAYPDDVDRYRRLKELAMVAKDHEREQEFFALELKAKRHYETTGWALLLNYAYGGFSGFGRSVMRPLVGLAGVWAGFGVGHGMFAKLEAGAPWLDGFRLSTAVLLPFVSSARTIYVKASEALYGKAPAQAWALDLAVVTESVLGLVFLFLLGLGLRNRFRL